MTGIPSPPTLQVGDFTLWGAQNGDVIVKFTKSISQAGNVNETATIRMDTWDRFIEALEDFEIDPTLM